jgi:hypothetical protein
LQSDPNVPAEFLDLAEPIALAMGALHRIERSEGPDIRTHADHALHNVRVALAKLQEKPTSHPAISAAMEGVAGCLGLIHALAKAAESPITATASIPKFDEPGPATAPLPKAASNLGIAATVAAPVGAAVAVTAPPPVGYPNVGPHVVPHVGFAPPPAQRYGQQGGPVAARPRLAENPYAAAQQPLRQQPQRPAEPELSVIATPGIDPNLAIVNADLGAHSTTNFYKGLAGNDIIEHGGIFVSTYKSPALGTSIRLRISLPGGYEFEAQGIVKWRRENEGEGGGATPGFGAQFTNIAPEAKHLIYRYVRNREPLFHDDL